MSVKITDTLNRFETVLSRTLDEDRLLSQAPEFKAAVHYALNSGGKRLRPLLVYATGEALGLDAERLDTAACALEYIHTYSLVHDDLPAMDDDIERRGQPTVHVKFDEATAILVGDYLQSAAFDMMRTYEYAGPVLTEAARAMVIGQVLDLQAEADISLANIESIHALKTAALLQAAIMMPLSCVDTMAEVEKTALEKCAQSLGTAYQIQDDLFDRGDGTLNSVDTMGVENAKQRLDELFSNALEQLTLFGERADFLRELTDKIQQRTY